MCYLSGSNMDVREGRTEFESNLGACPNCDATIPSAFLLISYETSDGWPKMFAECPACDDVVHPE